LPRPCRQPRRRCARRATPEARPRRGKRLMTARSGHLVFVKAVLLSALLVCSAPAQEAAIDPADAAVRDKWQASYKAIADSITMQHGKLPLKLLDQPLRFYTNPVRTNDQHGAIFLWTEQGRPAVIGSIWSA